MRCAALLALLSLAVPPPQSSQFIFHHVHFNIRMFDFYQRLFDQAATRREQFGPDDGLRSSTMLLLFRVGRVGAEQDTAIWHIGWGRAAIGETYLAHASRDVAWEPPLPANQTHLHLLSADPLRAAAWYRDLLGASAEVTATPATKIEPRPEMRVADAVLRFGDFALVIYRAEPPFASTRGQTIDHVAFAVDDLDGTLSRLRVAGVPVLTLPAPIDDSRSAMIEGPDRVAIEVIGK